MRDHEVFSLASVAFPKRATKPAGLDFASCYVLESRVSKINIRWVSINQFYRSCCPLSLSRQGAFGGKHSGSPHISSTQTLDKSENDQIGWQATVHY